MTASRYDGREIDKLGIYPQIWERDGKEGLHYITEYYQVLAQVVDDAVRTRMGRLITIS